MEEGFGFQGWYGVAFGRFGLEFDDVPSVQVFGFAVVPEFRVTEDVLVVVGGWNNGEQVLSIF